MSCDRSHNEPGFCSYCSHGELLDTHIESELELLIDRRTERSDRWRMGWHTLLSGVLYLGTEVGVSYLLTSLGVGYAEAGITATVAAVVVLTVSLLWLKSRMKAPMEDTPFSEIDPVQWEDMVAEPLTAEEASRAKADAVYH